MLLIKFSATTNEVHTLLSSKMCDTCVDIPSSTDMRGSLYMALPAISSDGVPTSADLICALHGLSNNCINLSKCENFDTSMYKGLITVCLDENMALSMCFHSVPREINGTKVFFFYSNLQCVVNGQSRVTRRYTKSLQLITEGTGFYPFVVLSILYCIYTCS